MKRKDINNVWAWARVEAMADGSLDRDAAVRMHEAMRHDAELDAAVRRAAAVRRGLKSIRQPRVPRGLLARLLTVPGTGARHRGGWNRWAAVPAVIATAVVVAAVVVTLDGGRESEADDARLAALQEFNVAMHYLQKSVAIANERVESEVGYSVLGAMGMSSGRLADEQNEETGG